jgi:nitroreductase
MADVPLHPLLASRWSPTAFDPTRAATPEQVDSLLQAARWAPSAGNSQPWAFIVGVRGDHDHQRLVEHLAPSARRWAPDAALLIANLAHRKVEDTDWDYSEFSAYDLGQAVAHLTVQARSLDLYVRQFRAFDREALEREFDVPAHWEITTMSALGWVPPGTEPTGLVKERERERRPLEALRWPTAGEPGSPGSRN